MKETLLTTKEAAKYLSMSEDSLRQFQARRQIPFIWLGSRVRYRKSDLDSIIRKGFGKKSTEPVEIPVRKEHPFRQMLKDREIYLWQIASALGFSESLISRQLNGNRPMPEKVETFIRNVLETVDMKGEEKND